MNYIFKDKLTGEYSAHTTLRGLYAHITKDARKSYGESHVLIMSKNTTDDVLRDFVQTLGYEILPVTLPNIEEWEKHVGIAWERRIDRKWELIDALQHVSKAIQDATPFIDELNGRLTELGAYADETNELNVDEEEDFGAAKAYETINDLDEDLYSYLPVWYTLDEFRDRIADAIKAIEWRVLNEDRDD